jgi:uncharacterized protein (TIGR02996 family)
MDSSQSLLQAIYASPNDDLPRLAYADWLDDHCGEGQHGWPRNEEGMSARAELIRLQVRRHSDPAGVGPAEREREESLVAGVVAQVAAAAELTTEEARRRTSFDRGIVSLNLSFTDLTDGRLRAVLGMTGIGDLDLAYTRLTSLPDNLTVCGRLVLAGIRIDLPTDNMCVDCHHPLNHVQIGRSPGRFTVGGDVDLSGTPVTTLPNHLYVGGDLNLAYTPVATLPEDLRVGGHLFLNRTPITEAVARRIPDQPGLSPKAKVSGLRSLGYDQLADQVERASERDRGRS